MDNASVAFETDIDRGYQIRAIWGDSKNARIEVRHISGRCHTFEYPAYKVFNIAAHSEELIDSLIEGK